jgi:hypothetical protein
VFCSNIRRKRVGVGVRDNGSCNGLSFERRRCTILFDNVIFSLSLPKSLDPDEDSEVDNNDEREHALPLLLLFRIGFDDKFIIFVGIHIRDCFFMSIL